VNHFKSPDFWHFFRELPSDVQDLARQNYALLKLDSRHPSLHLKKVGEYWSVRVGRRYRALATGGRWWVAVGLDRVARRLRPHSFVAPANFLMQLSRGR
jgi:hypothetical protein